VGVPPDCFCGFARDYGGEGFSSGLLDVAEPAEVSEPALAMIADGEAVALVSLAGRIARRSGSAKQDNPSRILTGISPHPYFSAGFGIKSSSWLLFHSARSFACSFCIKWIPWINVCITSSSVRPGAKAQLSNRSVSGLVSICGAIHVSSNPFTSFTLNV